MTHTTDTLNLLATEEALAWAHLAETMSDRMEDMFLGNAQGGEADFDNYELQQLMASGY